ncbi:MAG: DUF2752 domain-containing protein [Clostridia bacterium]|nr:DUF2752 domain-containing protein [Clostridia bacterium]
MKNKNVNRRFSPSVSSRGGIIALISVIFATVAISIAAMIYQLQNGGLCLLLGMTGIPCPGCGLTRATLSALRGDLSTALAYHPLFAVPYILIALGLISIPLKKHRRLILFAVLLLAAAMIVCWIVRLAGGWNGYDI